MDNNYYYKVILKDDTILDFNYECSKYDNRNSEYVIFYRSNKEIISRIPNRDIRYLVMGRRAM